jgi:hypothetical protein
MDTIRTTTSILELTELLKKTFPGDQFMVMDPNTRLNVPSSFGQWLISRINIGDLNTAKQQVVNEILGRIYTIATDTTAKSKIITPWDVQVAILRASYITHFFETVGNGEIQALIRDAKLQPGFLPITVKLSEASITQPFAEEFIVGILLAQKGLMATDAANIGQAQVIMKDPLPSLTFEFMGKDISGEIETILNDTRYYDVRRPFNTSVAGLMMWFNSGNLPLGVDYYCKIVGRPTSEIMVGYSTGMDPAIYSIDAVVNPASIKA